MPEWAIGVPGKGSPHNSKAHRTCVWGTTQSPTASRCLRLYRTSLRTLGVPDAVVMALVGHESSAMSHRYTHVGKEALCPCCEVASRNLKAPLPDLHAPPRARLCGGSPPLLGVMAARCESTQTRFAGEASGGAQPLDPPQNLVWCYVRPRSHYRWGKGKGTLHQTEPHAPPYGPAPTPTPPNPRRPPARGASAPSNASSLRSRYRVVHVSRTKDIICVEFVSSHAFVFHRDNTRGLS